MIKAILTVNFNYIIQLGIVRLFFFNNRFSHLHKWGAGSSPDEFFFFGTIMKNHSWLVIC